ncbi:right-handed parallel beta-helix repeat-containing protein, partial [bacterium]|nr:right-handed parallel beta-helix repeat-containing protein [bacterium]
LQFQSDVTLFVDGTLTAEGTAASSIVFTSSASSPSAGDWNGIHFRSGGSGSVKYAAVRYAATAVTAMSASPTIESTNLNSNNNGIDCFSSSSAVIRSNQISNNVNSAVRCNSSSPTIKTNRIFDNDAFVSAVQCDGSSPVISGNTFYGNGNSAIDCVNGSQPNILQNTIIQNDIGITLTDSNAEIVGNIIALNEFGILGDNSSPTIEFNNVWSNSSGDFQGVAAEVGNLNSTNANGDPSDVFSNIMLDPDFVNLATKDLQLDSNSPSIDAADPTNPAGIIVTGLRPDQGAFEFGATVPVELVSFAFNGSSLKWTTASETNNLGFEVQRASSESVPFEAIGFVRGAGTTVLPKHYEFQDDVTGGIFYYRLKQIDTDGSFEFGPTIRAEYYEPSNFALHQNFPNPFNPSTTITFEIENSVRSDDDLVVIRVYNSLGQEIIELLRESKPPGVHEIQWSGVDKDGLPVPSGVYFYQLRIGKRKLTRRMILQK